MGALEKAFKRASSNARRKRAALFRNSFELGPDTKVLDLGSYTGEHIRGVLEGTPVRPENIYIADIDAAALKRGHEQFGFTPVLIGQSGKLPLPDGYFDIVYCSSVIEHVTIPKSEVWTLRSGKEFRERSLAHQREFAREIVRVGRQFFVQTPYRWFFIESHSALPFVAWLPRRMIVPILWFFRSFWFKRTAPDWYLLTKRQLSAMFDGAEIRNEKWLGFTKSIMAVKTEPPAAAR